MKKSQYLFYGILCLIVPNTAHAMHIAEGYLPFSWSLFWWGAMLPFLIFSIRKVKRINAHHSAGKVMLAVATAFVFLLSSLKLPSVAGSSSHLTGIALGAILFGVSAMSLIGFTVLLFQALLLAHGGISTLGANVFSMAIVGSMVAIGLYRFVMKTTKNISVSVLIASFFSSMVLYTCTALQLALAHSGNVGFMGAFEKFLSVFIATQFPLAIIESVLTLMLFNYLHKYNYTQLFNFQTLKNHEKTK